MNTKQKLRLNGYSVNDAGFIECHAEGKRHEQERTAIIVIRLARDTRAGRAMLETLIAAADSPRALLGRTKTSALLLFKADSKFGIDFHGYTGLKLQSTDELATRDNEVRLTITQACLGANVNCDLYSWPKGRSPLDIERDSLPLLTPDIRADIVKAAQAAGQVDAFIVDQDIELAARSARYEAESVAETEAERDRKILFAALVAQRAPSFRRSE